MIVPNRKELSPSNDRGITPFDVAAEAPSKPQNLDRTHVDRVADIVGLNEIRSVTPLSLRPTARLALL